MLGAFAEKDTFDIFVEGVNADLESKDEPALKMGMVYCLKAICVQADKRYKHHWEEIFDRRQTVSSGPQVSPKRLTSGDVRVESPVSPGEDQVQTKTYFETYA